MAAQKLWAACSWFRLKSHCCPGQGSENDVKSLQSCRGSEKDSMKVSYFGLEEKGFTGTWSLLVLTTKALSIMEITCQPPRFNCRFSWLLGYFLHKKHQLQSFESEALQRLEGREFKQEVTFSQQTVLAASVSQGTRDAREPFNGNSAPKRVATEDMDWRWS